MTMFMKQFVKWCDSDEPLQESQNQCDRLQAHLASINNSAMKWKAIVEMNQLEVEQYDQLRKETCGAVENAKVSIDSAKQELEEAKRVRLNRMEYDALARLIKEHPPRSDTANKLAHLTQELHSLKNKRDQLEEKLSLRRKQLHVLVTALHQLQYTLSRDPQDVSTSSEEVIDLTGPQIIDLAVMDTT
ncbi:THO complex subunit 7 isoform X2 [Oratosquilla oratoria]